MSIMSKKEQEEVEKKQGILAQYRCDADGCKEPIPLTEIPVVKGWEKRSDGKTFLGQAPKLTYHQNCDPQKDKLAKAREERREKKKEELAKPKKDKNSKEKSKDEKDKTKSKHKDKTKEESKESKSKDEKVLGIFAAGTGIAAVAHVLEDGKEHKIKELQKLTSADIKNRLSVINKKLREKGIGKLSIDEKTVRMKLAKVGSSQKKRE